MNFLLKVFVACLVGFAMMCAVIVVDASDMVAFVTYLATSIAVAAVLGAFDESAKSRHMSLKDGARSYDQAA